MPPFLWVELLRNGSKLRVVNWNIARHAPRTWQAKSIVSEVKGLQPDVVCFTEARLETANALGGFTVASPGVAWSVQEADERKVLLWSKTPMSIAKSTEKLEQIGGAIEAHTVINNRPTRLIGLCIPYHMASPHGVKPKKRMWAQHNEFVFELSKYIEQLDLRIPTIIMGDFNRRIPRTWGPKISYEKLMKSLVGFEVVTKGLLAKVERTSVDHIALSNGFSAKKSVWTF